MTVPVVRRRVFVHGIDARAPIGILAAEHGRTQALSVDIDVTIAPDTASDDGVAAVDYRMLAATVVEVANGGHIRLVETFAHHVATACARLSGTIERVVVTVRKPGALAPATAGVTLEMVP